MSAAPCLLSEEDLTCSICLDVFTDPVSTPCGHSFCKDCINKDWSVNTPCRCPLCKESFHTTPQLKTNIFISAMVYQFRAQHLTSICPTHQRPLELYCQTDHSCVCVLCSLQHRNHMLISLREARQARQEELNMMTSESQRMILERRVKVRQVQRALVLSQMAAETEAAEGVQLFSALMEILQEGLNQVRQEIQEKQLQAKTQADDLMEGLEQEICELEHRISELEHLSRSEDHFHVIQSISSIRPAPHKDLIRVRVIAPSYFGTIQRAVLQTEKDIKNKLQPFSKAQLEKVQRSAVDISLDPDTAHPELRVSEDLKQVSHTAVKNNVPANSKRITGYHGVLGEQGFSSGRLYFEVQVKENYSWIVGVAKDSINRKEEMIASPSNGFWAFWINKENDYGTADPDYTPLPLKRAVQVVGVFVDCEEGLVCFYDALTADLIHCFSHCHFTEKLYPYFYTLSVKDQPSAPLVITSAPHDT